MHNAWILALLDPLIELSALVTGPFLSKISKSSQSYIHDKVMIFTEGVAYFNWWVWHVTDSISYASSCPSGRMPRQTPSKCPSRCPGKTSGKTQSMIGTHSYSARAIAWAKKHRGHNHATPTSYPLSGTPPPPPPPFNFCPSQHMPGHFSRFLTGIATLPYV